MYAFEKVPNLTTRTCGYETSPVANLYTVVFLSTTGRNLRFDVEVHINQRATFPCFLEPWYNCFIKFYQKRVETPRE